MDRDALVRELAEFWAGLQVPVSLGMQSVLGQAYVSWQEISDKAPVGFGWKNADDLEEIFRKILFDDLYFDAGEYDPYECDHQLLLPELGEPLVKKLKTEETS